MLKKQWPKKPNNELIVGSCKWCDKELLNTDSYVTFATKERSCLKCYRRSGASLPMFNK